MEPLTWVGLSALVIKVVSFVKAITAKATNAVLTQAVAWVSAVVFVFLAAQADIAAGLTVGDVPLASFDWASLVIIGLTIGSAGSFAYDVKKAIDRTDSAVEPQLMTGKLPPPAG